MKQLIYILLTASVLCLAGCATTRKTHSSELHTAVKDSVIYVERYHIDTFRVKADSVSMILSPVFMRDTVWKYIEQTTGRAKVSVMRVHDTLFITGSCDSIYHLLLNREVTSSTNHSQSKDQVVIDKSSSKYRTALLIVIVESILLVLAVAAWVVNKIYNPIKI